MRDVVAALVCAGLSVLLLTWLIPAGTDVPGRVTNPALSPAFWPWTLALALAASSGLLSIQKLREHVRERPGADALGPGGAPRRAGWARPTAAIALLVPYYLACVHLGLLIPSIVAFVVYALLAGERRYMLVAACGILMPTAITLFFIQVANVLIPLGPLWRLL